MGSAMLGYRVPLAMATQHPDSASRGFSAEEEVEEALRDILPRDRGGLGLDEKMVDYEGKLTPYHQVQWVVERLVAARLVPGEDFLVTPRVPSERLEDPERQVMVLWGVLVANKKAMEKTGGEAVHYIINPMSRDGYEVFIVQRRIMKLQRLASEELGLRTGEIRVVPLIEDFQALLHADKVLEGARNALLSHLGIHYDHYRVLLGKSDTALAYGHIASSLALVYALSRLHRWAEETNTRVYPILGVGALPFRGHLSPWSVGAFVEQYRGYATATIQSGLRFDQGPEAVRKVVDALRSGLHSRPRLLGPGQERLAVSVARISTREYLALLLRIARIAAEVASFIPRRRARLSQEEYPRSLDKSIEFAADPELIKIAPRRLRLPRAIGLSAALYTMGIPPALIGLGRALKKTRKLLGEEAVDALLEMLPLLALDAEHELQYYSPRLVRKYVRDEHALRMIEEDVEEAKTIARRDPGDPEPEYEEALLDAYEAMAAGLRSVAEEAIARAGRMRGSLG